MKQFFNPRSVVVFGVSDSPSNMARIIVENCDRFAFRGNVYPIGTSAGMVAGRKILASLNEIEETPELAVLLVPARFVPQTLEACGQKGIGRIIIESGGFSEFDEGNKALEAEVSRIATRWGMKVIGPNCFGVINLHEGVVLPFFVLNPDYMKKGSASLISQSGGIFYDTCMLASFENVGLSKLVSMGNKLLANEIDCLRYLVGDESTDVVGLYLENFSDGRELMKLASETTKPVVCIKANRSPAGEEIARFHTTALAGDDIVADAALKQAGIHRLRNFREMIDCFKIFSLPPLKGKRLAMITRSGGHGVLAADAVHRHGFELAHLCEDFFGLVKSRKINVIRMTNPVDVGDIYSLDSYGEIMEKALQEDGVDGVAFVATFSSETDGAAVKRAIDHAAELSPRYGKPVVFCMVTLRNQWLQMKEATDFPIFTDVDEALTILKISLDHHSRGTRPVFERTVTAPARPIEALKPSRETRSIEPDRCFALLQQYGITVPDYAVVKTIEEARQGAQKMGYPVAVKIASPEILHKTEQGGVVLNIKDEHGLETAMKEMAANVYLVQRMAPSGLEVIVGGKADREFGPVILFGLGGIFVEAFKDTAIRVAPIDEATAEDMIEEIKGSALLKGFRGQRRGDMESLKKALVSVSTLLTEHPEIINLDINPLIVQEEGKGCVAVDVKIEVAG